VETPDGSGGMTVVWQSVATVWLDINQISGSKQWTNQHANPKASHVIELHYRSDVKATWRVRVGARAFNVLAVNDVNSQHRELQLQCEEYVNTD
jgi:SPP1 family predicted phage head-tail adaptor